MREAKRTQADSIIKETFTFIRRIDSREMTESANKNSCLPVDDNVV
jgi:hypothetical protein